MTAGTLDLVLFLPISEWHCHIQADISLGDVVPSNPEAWELLLSFSASALSPSMHPVNNSSSHQVLKILTGVYGTYILNGRRPWASIQGDT